ncbi:glycosyltransferase family 2 protein [Oscillibacter ruminantium]|uniref:glycosyltransferase family 2 protein n=1 Tax=Oscillibacter ruminantium TaxID=1263547 RepID=UPI00332E6645
MKTISVVIPTYNEEENIEDAYHRVKALFDGALSSYRYEIIYIDNDSSDCSRKQIQMLCAMDQGVKAIFNAKNFGFSRSTYYGLTQATGDCAILLYADMQDPPEVIPEFVEKWESGAKIVCGVKNKSKENPLMYLLRKCYYKIIHRISEIDHIEQFDGFGLYDAGFIAVLRQLDDPVPYLRGIVAELGYQRESVFYEQKRREKGSTSFNFFRLYDVAMMGITSYSKIVMRLATFAGFFLAMISILIAIVTFFLKVFHVISFPIGTAAISIGVFFFGAVQLFFIGLLGEYIMSINSRVIHRPLVIEARRINFETRQVLKTAEGKEDY